ncbi:MFS transporter [soil metagenome]
MRAARFAAAAVFFLNGFGFASWVVRIPAVQEKLALSEGPLGIALLGAAVGLLISTPLAGWLVARLGSRPVVGVTSLLVSLVLLPLALAPNLPFLMFANVASGAAAGALDVSMNAQAVAVENGDGRSIMSSFHAAFSFGGLAGAASGGLVASLGVGVLPHLAGAAALSATAAVVAYRPLLPASADAGGAGGGPAFARPTRGLLGLGVISFCVLLGEGAMADWSAVYLRGTLDTGPGFAAAGYAAFSLTMATGRLVGDRLTARFVPARLVRAGAVVAASGLGLALVIGHPFVALAGFACAGAGFSIVFPTALSAAGRTEGVAAGPAIAAVSSAGYLGFLIGPPAIGFVAEASGLGVALFLVVILSAAIVPLARAADGKKPDVKNENGVR